jgi:hypothetical protein
VLRTALAVVLVLWAGATARAAELVIYEIKGCAWCAKWHREVGPIYDKTEEGHLLPLRQVQLGSVPADLKAVKGIKVAPTFVVVECGKEVGRIVGYQGDDLFWGELSGIIARLKTKERPTARC